MHLLVGLGNPGRRYEGTRHNVGYAVVEAIAATAGAPFVPGKGEYWIAECSLNNRDVTLLKPSTYMNESGIAVAEAVERFAVALSEVLVVCDDFQIPLGSLRIRPHGSDGGHNGLASVILQLGTEGFPRLRCGIGAPSMPDDKSLMADFVLSPFLTEEIPVVREMIMQAQEASLTVVADGIDAAMNRFNVRPRS